MSSAEAFCGELREDDKSEERKEASVALKRIEEGGAAAAEVAKIRSWVAFLEDRCAFAEVSQGKMQREIDKLEAQARETLR